MSRIICPRDCDRRSVEPSCRATCETWQKHLAEQAEKEKRKDQARAAEYQSIIREQKLRKQAMRKKAGRP